VSSFTLSVMRNLFCVPLPVGAGEFRLGISGRAYTAPLAFMEQTSGGKPLAECAPQPTHRGNEFFNLGAPATAEGSEWQSRKRVGHSFQTRDARSRITSLLTISGTEAPGSGYRK